MVESARIADSPPSKLIATPCIVADELAMKSVTSCGGETPLSIPRRPIEPSIHVEHHGAAVDDAAAFTEYSAAEAAGVSHEGRVAEAESLDPHHGGSERHRIDERHQSGGIDAIGIEPNDFERVAASASLTDRLLVEEVRSS